MNTRYSAFDAFADKFSSQDFQRTRRGGTIELTSHNSRKGYFFLREDNDEKISEVVRRMNRKEILLTKRNRDVTFYFIDLKRRIGFISWEERQ